MTAKPSDFRKNSIMINEINRINLLLRTFFKERNQKTLKSYQLDLEKFRRYLQVDTLEKAVRHLIDSPHSQANLTVMHYKSLLQKIGLKPATINRRLSALRSLVKTAYMLDLIPWQLEISNDRVKPYEDTEGPGIINVQKMLKTSRSQRNRKKAVRDHAILRLLYDLALKRGMVVNLDLADLDLNGRTIHVADVETKKKRKRLPAETTRALKDWISIRGIAAGPLFLNLDHAGKGNRLTGTSIYRIIRQLGDEIGIKTGPSGLRHTAISEAVKKGDEAGIEAKEVAAFSDHKNPEVLLKKKKKKERVQEILSKLIAKQ